LHEFAYSLSPFLPYSSEVKSKIAKSEEVAAADSSQHVTSATLTGAEAYDTSYSTAAAYTAAASAYSYSTPLQASGRHTPLHTR